jgi:hypothetical protein
MKLPLRTMPLGAWSTVHGFAHLALDGKLAAMAYTARVERHHVGGHRQVNSRSRRWRGSPEAVWHQQKSLFKYRVYLLKRIKQRPARCYKAAGSNGSMSIA